MQQKMMKYMMVFFGLMFYKVAAGLCLYFIASSLWGFAERKLLPKKKPGELPTPIAPRRPTLMQRLLERLMEAQRRPTGSQWRPRSPRPRRPGAANKRKRRRPTPASATAPGRPAGTRPRLVGRGAEAGGEEVTRPLAAQCRNRWLPR